MPACTPRLLPTRPLPRLPPLRCAAQPAAFYKGLLLPLCASGSCSLREAVIISSVLRRTSIPALHSAAAMLRIAGEPCCRCRCSRSRSRSDPP